MAIRQQGILPSQLREGGRRKRGESVLFGVRLHWG